MVNFHHGILLPFGLPESYWGSMPKGAERHTEITCINAVLRRQSLARREGTSFKH